MKAEIDALEDNGTWSVVSLPVGKHVVGCKWVFKIKYNADGYVERTRLVWWQKDILSRREYITWILLHLWLS